jgi:hypothetical protein
MPSYPQTGSAPLRGRLLSPYRETQASSKGRVEKFLKKKSSNKGIFSISMVIRRLTRIKLPSTVR